MSEEKIFMILIFLFLLSLMSVIGFQHYCDSKVKIEKIKLDIVKIEHNIPIVQENKNCLITQKKGN